ncbi:MAG TPA: hypothetical protein VFZ66_16395 [Herpetosiphonaceae bacterium]
MNDASTYILRLARHVAAPYIAHPHLQAIMVTGSAADGSADYQSDLDLIAYYAELPSEEDLAAACRGNRGANHAWLFNERQNGSIAEAYDVYGVQCQVMHSTIGAWEQHMATVLEQLDVTSPLQKALSGILKCIPLHGEDQIRRWQARAAAYPDALARAMVEHYLQFSALWGLSEYLEPRDAMLWRYQMTLENAQNILGVLAGLNRQYYTTFQFKRMRHFIAGLEIAPSNLAARLEYLFEAEARASSLELEELVRETVALVEQHMPQIDTARGRRRIGWRREAWQPVAE